MKFRLLCFSSHLLISSFIAALSLYLVFWLWYPSPLDKALGVTNIFILLLCIDVILGPLLTLIIAKQGKKTLKMDLLTIAFIQMAALAYGLYIVLQGRPVWIIYDTDRFELVQAYEAVLSPSSGDFHLGISGPVWGAVKDSKHKTVAERDAYYRAEFLQIYDKAIAKQVSERSRPLAVLKRFNEAIKVDEILKKYPDANRFVPLAAKQQALSILIKEGDGAPIAIVDLSPW